jgi:NADH-quinone oxidoreductase subunit L
MVAAGVFLIARVYPLMAAHSPGAAAETTALQAVTWIGAITAVFAASIAVAQTDIKRILAYSTVSQLGFMMMGLGAGGVAVGMFHLITHAFFKALLFLGAGSVIHGCHEEQDIRRMGGLRKLMPVTFAAYAVGMLALSGFPLLFSGFWSKDEILRAAHGWSVSQVPFYLGLTGALLTAFYMTRQVVLVFFGSSRSRACESAAVSQSRAPNPPSHDGGHKPHESPAIMTMPLVVLAVCAVGLSAIGTPAWPWFQGFLDGERATIDFSRLSESGILSLMTLSSLIVLAGLGLGWRLYGRKAVEKAEQPDVLERLPADFFTVLQNKYWIDEIYEHSIIAFNAWWSRACDWLDTWIWNGAVQLISYALLGLSWVNRFCDDYVVNLGFDEGCRSLKSGGKIMSRLQDGRVQHYLRVIGVALIVLALALIWGGGR